MLDFTSYFDLPVVGASDDIAGSFPIGYSACRSTVTGRALLSSRQGGLSLVTRLKDSEGALQDEVEFWTGQVLQMLPALGELSFSCVANPPPSGKHEWHLATAMAQIAARMTGLPYKMLFQADEQRGHRASMQEKLRENIEYQYLSEPSGSTILVIDDVMCTGKTAQRCVRAAEGDSLRFLFLYRS